MRHLPTLPTLHTRFSLALLAVVMALPAASQPMPNPQPSEPPPMVGREGLGSTLWMQTAHEYRFNTALIFRMAHEHLKPALATPGSASLEQQQAGGYAQRPPAVIVDLDETMIDNSAFQAYLVQQGQPFSEALWRQWLALREARAVPGALAFARAVSQSGAKIFYISNRACETPLTASTPCPAKAATMSNLKALGFPRGADPQAVLLRNEKPEWAGDKTTRRQAVAQRYRIVMMLGDDLQDFMPAQQAQALRAGTDAALSAASAKLLGQRWFVLPNPMYGSWDRALPAGLAGHYGALRAATLALADPATPPVPPTPPQPATARDLTLASWNLEWLMTPQTYDALLPHCNRAHQPRSNERAIPCTPGHAPVPRRTAADLDALARVAERIEADVVALQEVDGPDAAALVFRQGWALDCFVSRAHPQKVGFAIRSGIPYRCNAELAALDPDGTSRAGADLTLYPDTPQAVRLLAVHLKSGCSTGALQNSRYAPCIKLRQQVPVLARWVDERAQEGTAYAILGDFNRRLERDALLPAGTDPAQPNAVFNAISDGVPVGATLQRGSQGQTHIKCSATDTQPREPIDNVLIGAGLATRSTGQTWQRITYDNDEAARLQLSDHCPVQLRLQHALH